MQVLIWSFVQNKMSAFSRSALLFSLVRCIRRQQQFPCLTHIKTAQSTAARGRDVHSFSARYLADRVVHPWTLYQRSLSTEVPDPFMYKQFKTVPYTIYCLTVFSPWYYSFNFFRHHLKKMITHLYPNTPLMKSPKQRKCSSSRSEGFPGHVLQRT